MNTRLKLVSLLTICALVLLLLVQKQDVPSSPESESIVSKAPTPKASNEVSSPVIKERIAQEERAKSVEETLAEENFPMKLPEGTVIAMKEEALPGGMVQRVSILDYGRTDLPVRRVEKGTYNEEDEFQSISSLEMAAHRILVRQTPGVDAAAMQSSLPGTEFRAIREGLWTVSVADYDLDTVNQLLSAAVQSEFVSFAEPDYVVRPSIVPNDALYSAQWALNNTGQTGGVSGADISAEEAWDTERSAFGITIAVIDSGARVTHEDLENNIWVNLADPIDGIDNDGNGIVDDYNGYNAVYNTGNVEDDSGHGTHVAGIAAASTDNSVGVAGVAWNARILPIKFLFNGVGSTSDAIMAIEYAVYRGADIINASWGGAGYSADLLNVINYARLNGVVFVAAAGNNGIDIDETPIYPAAFNLDSIVSVGSSTDSDEASYFSNYGQTSVDLFAPGTSIMSTWYTSDSSYTAISGTSMASPVVAGALAVVAAEFDEETYEQWILRIKASVDRLDAYKGLCETGGRLNLNTALEDESLIYPPQIFTGLGNVVIPAGTDYRLRVTATGTEPMTVEWKKDGEVLEGETEMTLSFDDIQGDASGLYLVTITNEVGSATSSGVLRVTNADMSLGEAIGDTKHTWVSSGDETWLAESYTYVKGETAVQSGSINYYEESALETTVEGKGTVSFWWRVSSETYYDKLQFYVDDILEGTISGEQNWSQVSFEIDDEGEHVLKWVYSKDGSVSIGEDAGYIDGFEFSTDTSSAPVITEQPTSIVVAEGGTAEFDVGVTGSRPMVYHWYKDGVYLFDDERISGVDHPTIRIHSVTPEDAGFYHAAIYNDVNSVSTVSVELTVSGTLPPSIVSQPEGVTASVGERVDLSATVDGSEPITYQWYKDGKPIAPYFDNYIFPAASTNDSGTYYLTATNDAGEATSISVDVVIVDTTLLPMFTKEPSNLIAAPGDSVTLSAEVSETEATTFQWFKDGEALEGKTSTTLELTDIDSSDGGAYYISATNEFGSTNSRTATLAVMGQETAMLYALDAIGTGLQLESAGTPWQLANNSSSNTALRSGEIGNSSSSVLTTYVTGPGTLFYRWKVSSQENADFLQFRVDGVTKANISGEVDWETRSWDLEAGTHRLDWVYVKDGSKKEGEDAGFLDRIYIGDELSPLTVLTYFTGSEETENGWLYAPNVGFMWGGDFRWVYHQYHGWWYLSGVGGEQYWIYDLGLGWIFINSESYPFIYSTSYGTWLYYIEDTNNPRQFINQDNDTLIEVE